MEDGRDLESKDICIIFDEYFIKLQLILGYMTTGISSSTRLFLLLSRNSIQNNNFDSIF